MTTDYLITIGLLVGVFSIPAMISAYADDRFPRAPMAAFVLSAAVITLAVLLNPARYSFGELPNVVVRVIADILH
ncbi:hypothetical protein J7399_09610 [Shimia sp. R9_1]|uniref:hypothetical protein n=1 Tax=unclassified Shimia TaxID=2630038 RepID=UPI001ADD3793|nr:MULTISPECIES: hypothetical protein [unclassified Shimia]MBO9395673.1 hypothetical protein [Shimia sp. R9_2]MBO9399786.1 hypothetical protein [Shimia sp. R9_3]MBO9407684.1 hypothetical protein [Shimia sp. R9_1]